MDSLHDVQNANIRRSDHWSPEWFVSRWRRPTTSRKSHHSDTSCHLSSRRGKKRLPLRGAVNEVDWGVAQYWKLKRATNDRPYTLYSQRTNHSRPLFLYTKIRWIDCNTFVYQIFKSNAVNIFIDNIIKPFPKLYCRTHRNSRTSIFFIFKTRYRWKCSLRCTQNISDCVFWRCFVESVTALGTTHTLKYPTRVGYSQFVQDILLIYLTFLQHHA